MKLGKALTTAILALLLASLLPTSVHFRIQAKTNLPVLNVDTELTYTTIQQAIDADETLNGHTILVEAGTYYENLMVNKSVSLVGENKFNTVIDGRALGSIIHVTASSVRITGFTIRNSMYGYSGVHIYRSTGDNISDNILRDNYNGIYMYASGNSFVENNTASGNEYGIHLYGSASVKISGNVALGNRNGIHLDVSESNIVTDNYVSLSVWNGIYLYGSSNNTLLGNRVVSNQGRGIRLHYSFNNTLLSNVVSSNGYGIYFYGSDENILTRGTVSFNNESGILLFDSANNAITSNDVSSNTFGIWLINSGDNGISGNNFTSNAEFGVRLWNSSSNIFFHNNFFGNLVKNVEQPTNTSFGNLWDDGIEGNFWGDYDGAGGYENGIGNKPYVVDERVWLGVHSQDDHPLTGQYLQFTAVVENQSCIVAVVSNSTISGFQYQNSADNRTNLISFTVDGASDGFCLISIPDVLVEPPYVVTIDGGPLSYGAVRTNGTHTWVYFTYVSSGHELTIKPLLPPEVAVWSQWWFWGMSVLVLAEIVSGGFIIRYRRKIVEQRKALQAQSPLVVAQTLFETDVERRRLKIKEFEKKYGLKIQPRNTLEDVMGGFEAKKEEEKS